MLFNARFRLIFYPFFFLALPAITYLLDHLVWCNAYLFDQLLWCDEYYSTWASRFRYSFMTVLLIGLVDYLSYQFWYKRKSNKG